MAARFLRWHVFHALMAMAAAGIFPQNSSSAVEGASGISFLQSAGTDGGANLSQLDPVTAKASRPDIMLQGSLTLLTADTIVNVTASSIAYVSCDLEDYHGNIDAEVLLRQAADKVNLTAAILYSKTSDWCAYRDPPSPVQNFAIYSMTNRQNASKVLDSISHLPVSQQYFVAVRHFSPNSQGGQQNGQTGQQNPLGPSPSTAVAMIILYSITGIITALFLVIIITGAVRAHRHPDRYGPRNVVGRPRQSRARGLGRAILDTIPIVKFGEREPPKPTDVELGSTAEARDASESVTETGPEQHREAAETSSSEPADPSPNAAEQSGISPAQPLAAGAAGGQNNFSIDEGLGCSICTDDFEKGQDIRVLPCDHKFHPECVDPWLLNVSGTCPLCRIDLRPTTSRTSEGGDDDRDSLAPPLQQPDAESSQHHRRSAFLDILSLRSRPNASREERISALRRLREQRNNRSGEVAPAGDSNNTQNTTDDAAATRRSRRISARLQDVFSVRTQRNRRETSPAAEVPSNSATSATTTPQANTNSNNSSGAHSHPEERPRT